MIPMPNYIPTPFGDSPVGFTAEAQMLVEDMFDDVSFQAGEACANEGRATTTMNPDGSLTLTVVIPEIRESITLTPEQWHAHHVQ